MTEIIVPVVLIRNNAVRRFTKKSLHLSLPKMHLTGQKVSSAAFASIATKMVLAELPERCLYSSDAPYGEPYLYRQLIEFVSPDKRTAEMALGENISRLLKLH